MTRRSLDRSPDRITLRHGGRPGLAMGRTDRSRHLWTLMGGIAGALSLFWVMVQLGQASSDAQTTAPARATVRPSPGTGTSPEAQSEGKTGLPDAPLAPPSAQGPAIEIPQEIIAMLDLRKKDLDRREEAIRQEEARLLVLKAELESVLTKSEGIEKQMEETRRKMEKQTADQKTQQDQFLVDRKALFAKQSQDQKAQLAKMYESMPAEEAAIRLEQMPERKAIEMLRIVKGKTAGAILAQMKAERAARLTEQLLAPAP